MRLSDIIILPYSGELYKNRTSGIFIEGTILKKIILVSKYLMPMNISDLD